MKQEKCKESMTGITPFVLLYYQHHLTFIWPITSALDTKEKRADFLLRNYQSDI